MPAKGAICRKCGYMLGKWGVSCPVCRTRFDEGEEDVNLALARVARRHLNKLEERGNGEK